MSKIRITKRFTFEMAHALLGYDGLCKNIHGHSYVLWVTIIGTPLDELKNPKNGMLMDFSLLSKMIKSHIIEVFDHALLLNDKNTDEVKNVFKHHFEKVVWVSYQPTCENLLNDFSQKIMNQLPSDVSLFSLKLQETETSYAEWFAEDNV